MSGRSKGVLSSSQSSSATPSPSVSNGIDGKQVMGVLMPAITLVGWAGNFLVILLLGKFIKRRLPSHVLLIALAAVDIGFLLSLFCGWLESMTGWDITKGNMLGCKLITYTTHMTDSASVWLIVCISVERFIVLFYPNLRSQICSIENAKKATWAIIVIAGLYDMWVLVFATPVHGTCAVRNDNQTLALYNGFNAADTFISCFIPTVIILWLNSYMAHRIRRYFSKSVERGLSKTFECVNSPNTVFVPLKSYKMIRHSEQQLTKSMIIITSVYIAMNLPSYVLRMLPSYVVVPMWLHALIYVMYYAHHAISFYLYTFFGPSMRKTFYKLCRHVFIGCITCECCGLCCCCCEDDEEIE